MQFVKVGRFSSAVVKAVSSGSTCYPRLCSSAWTVDSCVCQTRLRSTAASSSKEIAVIRVPRYLQQRIESVKHTRDKNKISTVRAGKLLIKGRNPTLNQSAGYVLGKFEQPTLCSKGWKHNKSFGDYFTVNNTRSVAPCVTESYKEEEDAEEKTSTAFKNLNICTELVELLESYNIKFPTTVQRQVIPQILKGHNVLCAAETGSGKTLSYLLPIVQRLRRDEKSSRIRALVLVPSRELADQVDAVARHLCAPFGLLTRTVGGGRGVGHIKRVFKSNLPHILVATPGALVKAVRKDFTDLSNLRYFVVDEADTMFDPSFSDLLQTILNCADISRGPQEMGGLCQKAQLLVVGATFPGGVGEVLSHVTDLGSMKIIKSKMLHLLMPHVKQTFLKVKSADKVLELNQALKLHHQEKGADAVLVFCNKSATVNWLGYALDEMGVQHMRLQGEMPASVRTGIFNSFQNGAVDVLICTDIASRGLDTSRVHLVVNYDFPESLTDYIHRAGRVGRTGGAENGQVLSFVTHPKDVDLVQKIETAARRRSKLPGLETEVHEPKPEVLDE